MTLVSWLFFGFGAASAAPADRVAAVVNDEVVTLSEVYELGRDFIETRAQSGLAGERRTAELEVLDSLIRRCLVEQTVTELQIDATNDDVDRAIADIARRNGVEIEALRREIERSGVSWQDYRGEIQQVMRDQKFTQMLIRPRIVENEDEIRSAYQRMLVGTDQPERAEIGAIFLAFPADASEADKAEVVVKAESAKARVAQGEAFSAVSAEVDQGPYGKNGGTMGTFVDGELVETLNGPVFAAAEGEVTAPIVTGQGVFLLEVRKREKIPVRPYEEVRDEIAVKVFQGRIEREKDAWYQQARRQAAVVIKLEAADAQ
jgi:peptidyl-prolyl cis-trans isomerase SurA